MLTKCPECELQVSDKAVFCPHCGYPFQNQTKNPTRGKSRLRLPNGFGQITKITSKPMRNPWRVMVTVGKNPDTGRPICKLLKPQAYFASYQAAYTALVKYNQNPYDLDSEATLKEVFDRWTNEHFTDESSKSSVTYNQAIWRKLEPLHNVPIRSIRIRNIRECIEGADTTANLKKRAKSLLSVLFDFAIRYELTDRNYAREYKLSDNLLRETRSIKEPHKAFSDEEISILWKNADDKTAQMILVQIYMGWRPQELCLLEAKNIKDGSICGGMKTDAGKNRIVPIHSKIEFLIKPKGKYIFGGQGYRMYYENFNDLMERLNIKNHRPHDPRKTFVTLAKRFGIDEYAIKRIVGHKIKDVTEAIYTERDISWLKGEIEKIQV